jgi:hypothetical protein
MTLLFFILLFILSLFGASIVDFQTMFYMWFIYLIGVVVSIVLNKGENKIKVLNLYQILFFAGALYMMMCYAFMTYHNYSFLLAPDINGYFLPYTENYLNEGSYLTALKEIWKDYNFFNRFHTGYFTYATLFGFIGKAFDANFYVGQQISVLFLYPFIGILIYKLLQSNNFNNGKSFKYAIIISLFSVIFFYSSQILRDLHILLLYLIGIYLTFKKEFSIVNLLKIIAIIYINTLFRIETGLFLIVLIPVYLLLTLQNSKYKSLVLIFSIATLFVIFVISVSNMDQIRAVFEFNQENYVEGITEGDGMIATFQRIPIIGDLLSIIYNAAQPLPFWSRLEFRGQGEGPETFNIMNFPLSFASFFNWFVIIYIFSWLLIKAARKSTKGFISKPLKYHLWIGLFFLFMQSAVVAQRRLIAYYIVYYIFFYIIFKRVDKENKRYINIVAVFSFVLLQIVGLVYKM